jgi:hypothetical protein
MNKHWPLICLSLLAVFALAVLADERAELQFDGRKWKVGFQGTRGTAVITEYVLEGETVENRTESLTAQFLAGVQKHTKPEDFTKTMETKLRNVITGKLTWNVISTSPTEVMYEWTLTKDHLRPDEQEIVRIVTGADGLHIVHYSTQKVPLSEAARQKWIGLLNAAKIVK